MDCWSKGRAVNPASGAWLIAKFITAGQQVKRSILHKIHFISQGCPRPSIALTVKDHGLKHHSIHFIYLHLMHIETLLGGKCDLLASTCLSRYCPIYSLGSPILYWSVWIHEYSAGTWIYGINLRMGRTNHTLPSAIVMRHYSFLRNSWLRG